MENGINGINGNGGTPGTTWQGLRTQTGLPSSAGAVSGRYYSARAAVLTAEWGTVALCAGDDRALAAAWAAVAGIPLRRDGVQDVAIFSAAEVEPVDLSGSGAEQVVAALGYRIQHAVADATAALALGDWNAADAALHRARLAAQLRKERVQESGVRSQNPTYSLQPKPLQPSQ